MTVLYRDNHGNMCQTLTKILTFRYFFVKGSSINDVTREGEGQGF